MMMAAQCEVGTSLEAAESFSSISAWKTKTFILRRFWIKQKPSSLYFRVSVFSHIHYYGTSQILFLGKAVERFRSTAAASSS